VPKKKAYRGGEDVLYSQKGGGSKMLRYCSAMSSMY